MNKENRSIFKNRPLVKALAFFIAGVIFSTAFRFHYMYTLIPFIIALVLALYFYVKNNLKPAGVMVCIMLFFLGWFRTDLSGGPFPPNHIENIAKSGGNARLYGKVAEEPDIREDRTYLVIEADSVTIKNYTIPTFGRLRAKVLKGGSRYDHSDYVAVKGYLYKPMGPRNPGGFDYAGYLNSKNIFAVMSVSDPNNVSIINKGSSFLSSVVKPFRIYLIKTAQENLTPVSAAILSGFILGERRDIPEEYQTMFRDTGTLHLMAVSGSNVGLVIAVLALPLTLVGLRRRLKVIILLFVVLFFAVLTRLEASVVRASIMASIGLLAYGWLRKPDYINLLGFAGLVMLLWRPLQVYDVGLQLSFAATFGIVYAVPDLYKRVKPLIRKNMRWVGWIILIFVTTLAAQAAVMPLMALYFNRLPLIGLIANIPIGLLASFTLSLGVVFYFLSIPGGWLEFLLSRLIELLLSLVRILLRFFSDFPLAAVNTASFDWPVIFIYWIILYLLYEFIFRRRLSAKGIIMGLVCFNLMIWPKVFEKKPLWAVEFIDIGQNRAWIYTDKTGKTLGCFDIFGDDDYAERVLVPYILNFHSGRLEWLATSTPDSPVIEAIKELFSPKIIHFSDFRDQGLDEKYSGDKKSSEHPDWIKFVWEQSDNTEKGHHIMPCMQFNAGEYNLIMAGCPGTQIMESIQFDKRIALLELPWSVYARTDCLQAIDKLNPECVAFSPDRYTTGAPGSRSDLTHSSDRLFATSICGGFRVVEIDGALQIDVMKPADIKE